MFNRDSEVAASSSLAGNEPGTATPIVVEVTRHAALRYGERVRGAVHGQVARARTEIVRLVRAGVWQADPPPWLLDDVGSYEAGRRYVLLGPDVVFVVLPDQGRDGRVTLVVTVMTPWDEGSCHRADRRQRRGERWRRLHPAQPPLRDARRSREADGGPGDDDRLAAE